MTRLALASTLAAVLCACAAPDASDAARAGRTQRERADMHLELALAYLADGRGAIALQEARDAARMVPGDAHALHVLAIALAANGEFDAALETFDAAQAAMPGGASEQLLLNRRAAWRARERARGNTEPANEVYGAQVSSMSGHDASAGRPGDRRDGPGVARSAWQTEPIAHDAMIGARTWRLQ